MDYKAIARAISDPENQPHQWNDQDLAKFFVSAAVEIERLREALHTIGYGPPHEGEPLELLNQFVDLARSALQQKDSE